MINVDRRSPTEVLMAALASVEDARTVVILLESDDRILLTANCEHKDMKWLLDQAGFVVMKEVFDVSGE